MSTSKEIEETVLDRPAESTTQPSEFTILRLTRTEEVLSRKAQLCEILQDCVNEGSSIGFLAPLSLDEASTYWTQVSQLIMTGNLHLFILTKSSAPSTIIATVQLVIVPKVTHLHRAEVIKLLVSPQARRQGIARRLMDYVEDFTRAEGKEFLTLDTATLSPAKEMYKRLGWEEWGTCKDYASWPDGSRCDATFFRRELRGGKTGDK
ncbi:N-acetyltransferase GCN5 [Mollisia scopiformis]|uniref:N-acetyltransferase GCN5 n=1 Tax=Mollisia scopiformis TaxID=149040 RepID=A0A194XKR3_MOLSC|nr:N-acetyltransferase GCN5 [Mollisia scopiformis]KUJ20820.1 N-acetyltransferase GCN5 [Mollisia scopiformis]